MKYATAIALCGLSLLAACTSTDSKFAQPQPERASDINLELGIDALRKGNLPQAKEKIERAIDQNPRNAKAHAAAGLLYSRLADPVKSISHFDRALSLDDKDPEIKNNYAVVLCQQKRFERGEKLALEAAADPLYKTPAAAFVNAGDCARDGGNLQKAEENYRRALTVSPRFGAALFRMADLEYRQTNYLSARAFLERYLAIGRTTGPETLWLGVRIERSLGNRAAAQGYAQRLKDEYPSATETKELLESERSG